MSRLSTSGSTLSEWVPDEVFIGTSLILREDDRFLYGIRPPKRWQGQLILELTGIGGALEKEDESFSSGVQREAQEEIGCQVKLLPVEQTVIVYGASEIDHMAFAGDQRPAALVFRNHRTPPHQPWHPNNQGSACLIVFLGELLGKPNPAMELPQLIWLSAKQVLDTARRDLPLQELLRDGAQVIYGTEPLPSTEMMARMTDSQEALALALGDRMVEFYLNL